ncbi:hypothetical protein [Paenibacillus endophyticus]|uniref:hypothetical protein n=1 Tax=Paenibacillus endophyticus TaxID=1294268 RepID=UPI0016193D01|nr:hypothetical protein [Paenibacillus endophyticus]
MLQDLLLQSKTKEIVNELDYEKRAYAMKLGKYTLVTAHTGFGHAPDNTWNSFMEAIQHQADIAEVDVRVMGKGELILLQGARAFRFCLYRK